MKKGLNKAELYESIEWVLEAYNKPAFRDRPCVFLSHKKEDKAECRKIAEYLKQAEIDYYLDELDNELQIAAREKNPIKITESIKEGIRNSSHMLVVVSEKTYKSQWVPFEVGYGHSAILDKGLKKDEKPDRIKLSILTLKDISEKSLPDYMQVGNIIRGTKSLNIYISKITNRIEKSLINESRVFSASDMKHPLDNVLNWKL
ncbi:toll/interleukin-1 receptor domain-containing protein [Zunongwangia endophytica]|uniref:Toll/interleukin-1 receptor domain-containing protein n=1 Tax=Zunongwangia endophytica TaxID=1808945 RepID=A0ABV8HEY8_9FLAO|nr:toll/interleukin-1 receptor domain-containing protein [Zunongwangia endophytica]MDN3594177.1 toll/interleukin-1 receptor domain-containing protein [Zunongwangia endophytica]